MLTRPIRSTSTNGGQLGRINGETTPADPNSCTNTSLPLNDFDIPAVAAADPASNLMARTGVIEEEDLDPSTVKWLSDRGLMPEDFTSDFGLLPPEDAVIVRPYGGEDDDILLQELRPRFVVMYEPNLPFIRRLEVGSPLCNPH